MKAFTAIAFGAALLVAAPACAQSFDSYAIQQKLEDMESRATGQQLELNMQQEKNERRLREIQDDADRRMRDMEDQIRTQAEAMRLEQLFQPYSRR